MMRKVIKVDGTKVLIASKKSFAEIEKLIGAPGGTDCVTIKRTKGDFLAQHVMVVDDTGMIDGKPINPTATKIYHEKCGVVTPNSIHGDVYICPDSDYAK